VAQDQKRVQEFTPKAEIVQRVFRVRKARQNTSILRLEKVLKLDAQWSQEGKPLLERVCDRACFGHFSCLFFKL